MKDWPNLYASLNVTLSTALMEISQVHLVDKYIEDKG